MNRHRLLLVAAALGLVLLGALVGYFIAAPSATDIRNACVANQVVSHPGAPRDAGPRTNPIQTTPQVVTPVEGR